MPLQVGQAVTVKREKQASTLSLGSGLGKCHFKWDRLYMDTTTKRI